MPDESNNDAWLGLLKWSLKYVDGTVPSEESENFKQMSKEDIAFLEEVMKNGIIDEGKRMKTILNELVDYLDSIKKLKDDSKIEHIQSILFELQDIVEQIDFARSFSAMGGLAFLIGCATERDLVSPIIRSACLGVLGTMCQNNPPVQLSMLEQGNIPKLLSIYFNEASSADLTVQIKAVQAMSSCVRNHEVAETIFCMNADGQKMIESSLGLTKGAIPSPALKRKSLFFLQALITSDTADRSRVRLFAAAIQYVALHFTSSDREPNDDLREMALSMLNRILDQKKSVDAVLSVKTSLENTGIQEVSRLRKLENEAEEHSQEELNCWESLITSLARTTPDVEIQENPSLITN